MRTKVIGKIILILIILILILGGVFAYLYFATDMLKTNEQLFFKYLAQMVDEQEGFFDSQLTAYENKKLTQKYADSGKFYVDINIDNLDSEILTTVNNFNIEYSGRIDNTARKNEQDISINYTDDVNFPIKYKYVNETLGLQTDYVSSKYIGIENRNLKEFAEKLGITDTADIPDSIDFFSNVNNGQTITFTEEEKEQLKNTYQSILEERLAQKEFTKTEENAVINYSVEITNQEFKDLIIALLEGLKNDQILLPKIEERMQQTLELLNQNSEEDITIQNMLQEYIDAFNKSEVTEGTVIVTVSQTDRNLSGITLRMNESEVIINKSNTDGILTYGMEMNVTDVETQDTIKYFLTSSYQGLEQLASVNETYQFGIIATLDGQEQKLVYNLNCTDTFDDTITIEDYTEDEIQILNEYNADQLATLLTVIGERIGQVNTMQMEEIGFGEYGNPMLYAFPITSLPMLLYNQSSDIVNENSMNEEEIELFNQKFTQYEGEQRGAIVRSLLQTVLSNNMTETDENRKIEVSGVVTMAKDDMQAPTAEIQTGSTYNVELQYTEGRVSGIIITEQ